MPPTLVRAFAWPWLLILLASLILAAIAAACGDDDEDTVFVSRGALTDPRGVPTATPWPQPPPPIFLEEGAVTPIDGEEGEEPGGGETYIVQPGDTASGICLQLGCDHNDLLELNGITDPTKLQVGQELKIPPPRE